MKPIRTKGDIIVNDLKIGDTIYEYEYGHCIKSKVLTMPQSDDDGYWTWLCETEDGKEIRYGVNENYPHYAPNIYTYPAYVKCGN